MWQQVLNQPPVPLQDHLLMYGDFGYVHVLHVPQWHLAAALNSMEVQLMEAEVSSRQDGGAGGIACVLRPWPMAGHHACRCPTLSQGTFVSTLKNDAGPSMFMAVALRLIVPPDAPLAAPMLLPQALLCACCAARTRTCTTSYLASGWSATRQSWARQREAGEQACHLQPATLCMVTAKLQLLPRLRQQRQQQREQKQTQ